MSHLVRFASEQSFPSDRNKSRHVNTAANLIGHIGVFVVAVESSTRFVNFVVALQDALIRGRLAREEIHAGQNSR